MPALMTVKDEADCLKYNPFAGDFGDQSDRILSDKMVTAAKDRPGGCCICFGSILQGERHRHQTGRIDGKIMHCRMCNKCCRAMMQAIRWPAEYGDRAIELRTELGMRRKGALGRTPEPNLTEPEFYAQKQRERVQASNERDASSDAERIGAVFADVASPPPLPRRFRWYAIGMAVVVAIVLAVVLAHNHR